MSLLPAQSTGLIDKNQEHSYRCITKNGHGGCPGRVVKLKWLVLVGCWAGCACPTRTRQDATWPASRYHMHISIEIHCQLPPRVHDNDRKVQYYPSANVVVAMAALACFDELRELRNARWPTQARQDCLQAQPSFGSG